MHGEIGFFSFRSFKERCTRTKVNITIKGKVNVKLTMSRACYESLWGSGDTAPFILNSNASWRWAPQPGERARQFRFNRKMDGPLGWSGLLPLPGIKPRFLSYPTRNRHYTAYVIATSNLSLAFLYFQ
jgi:hypothetical protein